MITILTSIANTIKTLAQLLVDAVKSLVAFVTNIPTYLQLLRNVLSLIPDIYYQYSLAFIIISAVLYALGRQENG